MDKRTKRKFKLMAEYIAKHGPCSIDEVEQGLRWHKNRLRRAIWKYGLPPAFSFQEVSRYYYNFLQGCNQGYNVRIIVRKP